MPPVAPDELNHQHGRSIEDDPSLTHLVSVPTHSTQEHEPTGKSKKKKGSKKKKAATEAPPEDLIIEPPVVEELLPPIEPEHEVYLEPEPEPQNEPEPVPVAAPARGPVAAPVDIQVRHGGVIETPPSPGALGSFGKSVAHDLTLRTDRWAQAVPYGKSPPVDLMDGDPSTGSPLTFPTIHERGFIHPSSPSPPTQPRPFSYGSGYRSSMHSRQQSVDRRKSHSYGSPMSNPAPPHLPQAHFYGAPDIDIPTRARTSDGAYSFCSFDTLPSTSNKSPRTGTNVLVVGTDGSVEIHAIEDRRCRLVGQVSGLNGRVLDAKILREVQSSDTDSASQPHVAVILHGPLPQREDDDAISAAALDPNEPPATTVRASLPDRRAGKLDAIFYQTRVEVYSLRSGEHVATLFTSQPVPSPENVPGVPSLAPSPQGSLKILHSGNHIAVTSGISGEVFIFRHTFSGGYQCLGKTWTNIQAGETRRYSTSSSSTDADGSHHESSRALMTERPLVTIQGRWLAVVPPSSARSTLHGSIPSDILHPWAQGVESRNPPTVPSVNCATDAGDGETLLDKVARGVTQELVKGARWMGDQGLQVWNNYWSTGQLSAPTTPPMRPVRGSESPVHPQGLFPPTHAQETQATSSPEPDTVAIIDLGRFDDGVDAKSASLNPAAVFQVPNGCSFLSLSPSGLMLFTASKKGDVQYIWDLMQMRHCRAMAFMTDGLGSQTANVRQVARYARLTASSIVDVIWTAPVGDRLAVVTRKGTVHVFDLPQSAFQWPPFRRARPSSKKSPSVDLAGDDTTGPAGTGNPLSAAMTFVGGKTQPFLSAVRGRVQSPGTGFPTMSGFALPTAASIKGGKVVAAGLSKSMGAAASGTVQTLRHVGENRLHLSGLARDPAPSRVAWMLAKGHIFMGVLDDGQFKLYRLKRSTSTSKNRQSYSVVGSKEVQFRLPTNMQSICGPAPLVPFDPEKTVQASLALPSITPQSAGHPGKATSQPLSQAEIETNTPYQPFHTDQRVSLHVFSSESGANVPSSQWVFGDDIPTTKLHLRSYNPPGDDRGHGMYHDAAIHGDSFGAGGEMENLITLGSSTGNVEEVVITTRRKKKATTAARADDGFFEDDCEVLDFARDRV
ncbi:Uncharacterized protein PECH_007213 [Penicillium ucsense]|uniref:Uncharacterized protein n=1 Tax=Penicillium ucsense TaxID=2839758 RepID=A0A8J8WIT5_9EURO|nr:Uncharacterized protein PECM_008002 [Penicillium ucsense]KAF7735047.1 Uncharacterized protein PECH_007213 [Penicillium ucsense]